MPARMKSIPVSTANSGLTRLELLVFIGLGVAVVSFLVVVVPPWWRVQASRFQAADHVSGGYMIFKALRAFSDDAGHASRFPAEPISPGRIDRKTASNDVLAQLLPKYLQNKYSFFNIKSAYCPAFLPETEDTKIQLRAGECDWSYVQGLTSASNARWPVLANAFAPDSIGYVDDLAKKGGVFRGLNAVVVYASGSAEIVKTKKHGDRYFVPRDDKPDANAFDQDGDWLKGDDVKVLNPK
jgi:hypothetical protein